MHTHDLYALVRARRVFPIDMLRYDCCYPATAADAAKVEYCCQEVRDRRMNKDVVIQLQKKSSLKSTVGWTVARWDSFGIPVFGDKITAESQIRSDNEMKRFTDSGKEVPT